MTASEYNSAETHTKQTHIMSSQRPSLSAAEVDAIQEVCIDSLPLDTHERKRSGVSRFFRRTWKAVKKPFLRVRKNKVEHMMPPLTHESRPSVEATSPADTTENRQEMKPTAVQGFFKRTWTAVKNPFLQSRRNRVQLLARPSLLEDITETESAFPELSPVSVPSPFEPSEGNYDSHYAEDSLLGSGEFGSVYKGTRKSDGEEVAIKIMTPSKDDTYVTIPGHSKPLLTEVALLLMVRQEPISHVVQMMEWYEDPDHITIIMEYPQPCVTLEEFIWRHNTLPEVIACDLMKQAVQAVQHCISHKVFHSDVHSANILVNTSSFYLKLIDFGCGLVYTGDAFDSHQFIGALDYCPPEVITEPTFHAIPANVWHLGLILYEMVHGCLPSKDEEGKLFVYPDLSEGCRSIIKSCLVYDPAQRPTFEEILQHRWFN